MEDRKIVTVYLVRHYFRTNKSHPLGPDLEAFYYYGKRGHVVGQRGTYIEAERFECPHDPFPFELEQYGYKRAGDAKRAAEAEKDWYARHQHDSFTGHMFTVVAEIYYK